MNAPQLEGRTRSYKVSEHKDVGIPLLSLHTPPLKIWMHEKLYCAHLSVKEDAAQERPKEALDHLWGETLCLGAKRWRHIIVTLVHELYIEKIGRRAWSSLGRIH